MPCKNYTTLKKRSDFHLVSSHSKSYKNKFFFFKIAKKSIINQTEHNHPIIAVTSTKKIGNAVTRNKIKRLFKAIFNDLKLDIHQTGYVYSFYARKAIILANYHDLKKEVEKIIQNVKKHAT